MKYWLLKSEPDTFSIDHLAQCINQTSAWDGVRNYQARNFMTKDMRIGDLGFFYHSSTKIPGIVGLIKITSEALVDNTAFDHTSIYFDPKSSPEKPRWFMVEVTLVRKFKQIIPLNKLREHPQLQDMLLLKRGNRLSITTVTAQEFDFILSLVE